MHWSLGEYSSPRAFIANTKLIASWLVRMSNIWKTVYLPSPKAKMFLPFSLCVVINNWDLSWMIGLAFLLYHNIACTCMPFFMLLIFCPNLTFYTGGIRTSLHYISTLLTKNFVWIFLPVSVTIGNYCLRHGLYLFKHSAEMYTGRKT